MRKLFVILTAMALIVAPAGLFAEDDAGTQINAGVNLTDGNSDTLGVNAGIVNKGALAAGAYTLSAEGNYGETEGEATVQNAKGVARYDQPLTDPMYWYLNAHVRHDDIANLDSEVAIGPGIGTYLLQDDAAKLGVEMGPSWVNQEFGDGTSDDFVALRAAQTYDRQLSETSKVWQSVEYLGDVDGFEKYLLNAEIGIEAAINSSMGLRLVVQDKYNSEPAAGAEKNDIAVLGGFSYKL